MNGTQLRAEVYVKFWTYSGVKMIEDEAPQLLVSRQALNKIENTLLTFSEYKYEIL